MFYSFSYTPDAGDTESAPHLMNLHLTAGVIHQVDVLFQSGAGHEIFVQIFNDNFQLWPSNRGEKLRGDAVVVSFREFYELVPGNTVLTAKIWTSLSADFVEVLINVGILPAEILQPFSIDRLLRALAR